MAEKNKVEDAKRETQARTELITVRLDQIGERRELYCHRDKDSFADERLKLLAEQLIREGLQVPVEVVDESPGASNPFLLVKGHRRVAALRLNVRMKAAGFSSDMEVPAFRVIDATAQDLVARSVSDNENRQNLSAHEKIRASKTLYDTGLSMPRAAAAMGISTSSFERSLLIASTPWMFALVAEGSIDPTPAYVLLTAAKKAGRLREFEEDLTAWVGRVRREIREKERKKAEAGKELSPAERLVKRYLKGHLVQAWKGALATKQRFDEIKDIRWRYGAELDTEARKLTIPGINVNLATARFADLAEVAAKLDGVAGAIRPFLAMKQREEQLLAGHASQDTTEAYLRRIGLAEAAPLLDRGSETEEEPEEDARLERELAGEIVLPDELEVGNE